jgi:multidrug efflux system outer membrane protein
MRSTTLSVGTSIFLAGCLLSGCAIGPNYERPEDLPEAPAFRGDEEAAEQSFVEELPWWEIFDDPALVSLTSEAIANNRDLALAVARVERARNIVGATRAELFPQLGYSGEAGTGETSENYGGGPGTSREIILGALDLAWEIDIGVRILRSTQAANADYLAS